MMVIGGEGRGGGKPECCWGKRGDHGMQDSRRGQRCAPYLRKEVGEEPPHLVRRRVADVVDHVDPTTTSQRNPNSIIGIRSSRCRISTEIVVHSVRC
eukprot:4307197-Pleurochrysis_carterae.AAC.2